MADVFIVLNSGFFETAKEQAEEIHLAFGDHAVEQAKGATDKGGTAFGIAADEYLPERHRGILCRYALSFRASASG